MDFDGIQLVEIAFSKWRDGLSTVLRTSPDDVEHTAVVALQTCWKGEV